MSTADMVTRQAPERPAPPPKGKKRPPMLLEVIRREVITEHMIRIVLGGEALEGFPAHRGGGHIKVFLPLEHQAAPVLPQLTETGVVWPAAEEKPITRTYSVRHFDTEQRALVVDFVAHGDEGPASRWALAAQPGDMIGISGPGGPDPLLPPADWSLIAGDMTALPAISALLENMSDQARGVVLIEVDNEADHQPLRHPSGVDVHWLYRGDTPSRLSTLQIDAVRAMTFPESGSISAWVGGENSAVLSLREHLMETRGLTKSQLYAVPYWRHCWDEERYHQERHRIMDELK
ncbi:NADPH-dependent ferric siderophore reductase, contains FAD-binding and SIP domains [Kushneria avicenniae]|uniref:NADPH-dependent ferric siderophore reductase, contains FAD-binding and SIP domains n=1 Tax=Kushneria avicenniae TaxID=402385 RepID=A0A1I1LQF4_9GAMM|nr:siderophore-interacting protein [Kushneria avicenniae]SFC75354.1 NADPH-dependent ferric siderophore reductase, contains FAD-binding and SIP domains [Kushneria avicenniae]